MTTANIAWMRDKYGDGPAMERCESCSNLRRYPGYHKCLVFLKHHIEIFHHRKSDWDHKWPCCSKYEKRNDDQ